MKDDIPENDALWRLLGQARQPAVSPFFARNVLREIRCSAPSPAKPVPVWLRWVAPAAYAALAIGFVLTLESRSALETSAIAHDLPTEFDPFAEFDELANLLEFTPAHLAGQ